MTDRSISKQYRWKVKSRLAVLEYASVHGLKPAATRFGLRPQDRSGVAGPGTRGRAAGLGPALSRASVPTDPRRGCRPHRPRAARLAVRCVPDPDLVAAGPSGQGGCQNDHADLRRSRSSPGPTAEAAPRGAPAQAL